MDFSKMDRRQLTMAASGCSVMLTLHFASQLLSQHLFYWKNPKQQKPIAIIILLAPLFAVHSFVGLLNIQGAEQIFMLSGFVKGCYEAFAIAKFLDLMYSYFDISMGENVVPDEMKGREIHHSFPMTLFQPKRTLLNHQTLGLLKNWTWQFVVIRPICSALVLTLHAIGCYPSWLSWAFTIVLILSISLALYSLVVYYHVFAKELEPHTPMAKFICIKGIVFFCFWQGVVLNILVAIGVVRSHHFWLDTENVGEALQNVLVSAEMVTFSVFQQYAYHVSPYSGDIESKLRLQQKKKY